MGDETSPGLASDVAERREKLKKIFNQCKKSESGAGRGKQGLENIL